MTRPNHETAQDVMVALTKHLVRKDTLARLRNHDLAKLPPDNRKPVSENVSPLPKCSDLKVCIIGAGIAGLYTALLLDAVGVEWKIIEANPRRLGGRLHTHYFDEGAYYDVGAMRYPDTPAMDRLHRLIQMSYTATKTYYMSSTDGDTPSRYDNITTLSRQETRHVEDKTNLEEADTVHKWQRSSTVQDRPPSKTLSDLRNGIAKNIRKAMSQRDPKHLASVWSLLLDCDRYSTRQILSAISDLDVRGIDWLDKTSSATGLLDHGIAYSTFGSLTTPPKPASGVEQTPPEARWYRIAGGGDQLIRNLLRLLSEPYTAEPGSLIQRIHKGRRVVKISHDKHRVSRPMEVCYTATDAARGETKREVETFDAVVNSTTLGALQAIDLTELSLPRSTETAIRSINYSGATKIAVKFRTPWWAVKIQTRGTAFEFDIKGGTAKTDMPIRNCVYPSEVTTDGPAVLLCSYTWAQDSHRLASMISKTDPDVDDPLMLLVLSNLAHLHTQNDGDYEDLLHFLKDDFITYHAYDWSRDEFTGGGGFAAYLPGQLESHYASLVNPLADARFHIIGEAASAHPGWVIGSLDSAARGVYMLLERVGLKAEQKLLAEKFGGFTEVDEEIAHLQVSLSALESGSLEIA